MRTDLQRLKRETDSSRRPVVAAAEPGIPASSAGKPVAATSAIPGTMPAAPLWKDADPDIPILKQANAEYAKLQ